jgi:hypothetical protein
MISHHDPLHAESSASANCWNLSHVVTSALMSGDVDSSYRHGQVPAWEVLDGLHLRVLSELFLIALSVLPAESAEALSGFVTSDSGAESFKRIYFWLNQNFELHSSIAREFCLRLQNDPDVWGCSSTSVIGVIEQLTDFADYLGQIYS